MTVLDHVRVEHPTGDVSVVRESVRRWETTYIHTAIAADLVVALVAALVAFAARFGSVGPTPYIVLSALFPLLWVAALAVNRAYEPRFLGIGSEEFRRVVNAAVVLTALVSFLAYATKTEVARGYVVVALPLAAVLDVAVRYGLRQHLHRRRSAGECLHRVVAVGHEAAVVDLVRQLRRERFHGLEVVGACLPTPGQRESLLSQSVPVVGGFDAVDRAVALTEADTVAVLSSPEMDGLALRRLAWQLEPTGVDLVVAPALMEVAGPRITIRPVSGLPLLHVEQPRFTGGRRIVKGLFDRSMALMALLMLSPLLLAIAAAIRLTSPGPALFRQTRVGRGGKEFTVLKFRTMCMDAEKRKADLLALNEYDGVLFKMRRDPRITGVGAKLRRLSLDELPQLINVLRGQMSLVGPRPPLPEEVAQYGDDVRRRLLVKPGLTGLWQVSGRSDLPWDEAVRLDLRYVDDWSLAMDLLILWKTGRAVLQGTGAY